MAKKIGVVLALDGEKEFRTGMQTATQQTKQCQSELKKLSSEYDGNANSLEALTKKQQALTKVRDSFQKKQEAAIKGLENANKVYEKQKKHLEELEKQEKEAREALKSMTEGSDEFKKQEQALEGYTKAVEKQKDELVKCKGKQASWQAKVNDAESDVNKMNTAIEENERYMKEAEQATDKCATSIDKYGKEAEGATKVTTSFSEKLKQAAANKLMDLGVSVIRELGDAAKEAAKYVVKVGSEFEASMSEVGSISGAGSADMKKMEKAAKSLGNTTKFSASEVANGFKYMSLAGWSTTDMLSGIDGVLNLAAASGMELAESSDMVTDYLSAFGLGAENAAHMADMMAYAQAHSNTSAEQLGEAYGNCAANLHSAGQDMETTTALLEAMANQGTKGSEAGTQLTAIMSQITQKMKDGKIAIGDTSVAVADQNGNFRDLTDIMTDVEAATEGMGTEQRSAALSAVFNRTALAGVNQILNEGMDKISGYEDQLRSCDGAAENMANTMQDNLQGDITKAGSALEGLGIAAYDYIKGPVRGVVQGVTSAINAITDVITPQKTELEEFISDIQDANAEVENTIQAAKDAMSGADSDVADLEAYKKTLLELNGETEKTEFQKYQIKRIVETLSSDIPELTAAFDEETGSIKLTNKEITDLIDNQEQLIIQNATMAAKEDAFKAIYDAEINAKKAESALEEAQTAYENLVAVAKAENPFYEIEDYNTNKAVLDAKSAIDDAAAAQEDANSQVAEAKELVELADSALEESIQTYGDLTSKTKENTEALGENGDKALEAGNDALEAGGKMAEGADNAGEAADRAKEKFAEMSDSIASSMQNSVSMLNEFSGGAEITADQIVENLNSQITGIENWKDNMATLAKAAGEGMSQELYDQLAAMGPESANLVQALVDSLNANDGSFQEITQKWTEAMSLSDDSELLAKYTSAGAGIMEATATGMTEGTDTVTEATQGVSDAATQTLTADASAYQEAGKTNAEAYASGLSVGSSSAVTNAGTVAQRSKSAIDSYKNSFYSAGTNMSQGVASGISGGESHAISAAANMARNALNAAKRELDIHSPSRKFKNEVGKQIGVGMALGINESSVLAENASAEMSEKVYQNGIAWMANYKKKNKVSLEDQKYFWQQMLANTKQGTDAYNKVLSQLDSVEDKQLSSKISSSFGVSKTSGKKKKSDSQYASDVYSAAEKYIKNFSIVNDVSLAQEEKYWTNVRKKLKSGTQAWYDATAKINDLKEQQATAAAKAAENARKEHLDVQQKMLSDYKIYYKVSAKAEADYWNIARQQFNAGTAERIEADKKYYDALQDYYDQRKKLDEDYADDSKKINDDLIKNVGDLQDAYTDAVKSRKEDILSQMNLFEAWDSNGYDADTLLYNLKTQVSGLALWEQQLAELDKKGIASGLLDELKEMGPDAAASIYSLNQMTAEQLDEYQKLWQTKNDLAQSQAVKENAGLLEDTNKQITQLRSDAQKELNELNADYRQAVAELSTGISSELRNLVNKSGQVGEDSVSSMIAGIRKQVDSVDTYNSTQKVVTSISDQLSALKETSTTIGSDALDAIVKSMTNPSKLSSASGTIVESIRSSLATDLTEALGDVTLNYSGVGKLNNLIDEYSSGSGTKTLSVDNSGLEKIMQLLLTEIQGLRYDVQNSEMELDGEVVAKRVSEVMASETIRTNRGML